MNRILASPINMTILLIVSACSPNREIYSSSTLPEKSAYHIELTIEGEKNRNIQLCKYLGTGICPVDTAVLDRNGRAIFAGNRPLVTGMYTIVTGGEKIFDLLVSDTVNRKITVSTRKNRYLESLSFDNSPENEAFADYVRCTELMKNKTTCSSENVEITTLAIQTDAKEAEIRTKFPGTLLQSVAEAMNPPHPKQSEMQEMPHAMKLDWLNDFRRKHYWDKFPLTDSRMIDTPLLCPFIDGYFDNMVSQNPDSIIRAIDFVLAKAESDTAMMNFITRYVFDKYFQMTDSIDLKRIGMEHVTIHIIDNYYLTGRANGTDEKFISDITEYANQNRTTLTGMQAMELKMETVGGGAESLYDIDSPYLLLCFYDASCSHCRHEIPEIYKIFQKYKNKGVTGFCVYTRDDKKEWVEFVAKYRLTDWINAWDPKNENDFRIAYSLYIVPRVYVLDKNKKIIGRHLDSASLERLLNDLIKNKNTNQ